MKSVVVFGAGGHAKVVIDIIEKSGQYEIAGLIDQHKPVGSEFCGYRVIGNESELLRHKEKWDGGIVAVGDNWSRARIVDKILKIDADFQFITAIHPSAQIARGAKIGVGTVIMPGAVIGSDAHIGEHCIINSQASVDHDSVLEDFVTLAPRATTGGNVHIGEYSAISLGACVIHAIKIGEQTVIGAGAVVVSDIDPYVVAYGVPAKVIRKRQAGESYL